MRIVSLLPSATEICFALGLEDSLVGVTHECDFPAQALTKPQVTRSETHEGLTSREIDQLVRSQLDTTGSIYELSKEKLEALRPDLILTQRLCTVCAVSIDQVRDIAAEITPRPQVVNLEPRSLDDVFQTIVEVAKLSDSDSTALLSDLRSRVDRVRQAVACKEKPKVIVLEWIDPPFASGHWIPELIEIAGGENVLGFLHAPSREVSWEEVLSAGADIVVVAECGFGVARQQVDLKILLNRIGSALAERSLSGIPEIWVCDGSQYFSRPGPRLVDTVEMLAGIFHKELREEFFAKFRFGHDLEQVKEDLYGNAAL